MKLEASLNIGRQPFKIISYDIALKLSDVGTATFEVQASSKPSGIVIFEAGYTTGEYYSLFIGYVDKAVAKSDKHWTLACKEICNALSVEAHISLRRCYLADVLKDINSSTGLTVKSTDSSKQVSRFTSTGDGFYALRSISRVFSLADFVWWQTKDGDVWCGTWSDSDYAQLGNLDIDTALFTKQTPASATLPLFPALRPGMVVNQQRLTFVRHSKHNTVLRWKQ